MDCGSRVENLPSHSSRNGILPLSPRPRHCPPRTRPTSFASKMDLTNFVYSRRDAALQIGDYGTYRTQLSRQLASARKRLGRSTPKNAKYTQRAPVTAEDIGGNPEYVTLRPLQFQVLTVIQDSSTSSSLPASEPEHTPW